MVTTLEEVECNRKERQRSHDVLGIEPESVDQTYGRCEGFFDPLPICFDLQKIRLRKILDLVLDWQALGQVETAFEHEVLTEVVPPSDAIPRIREGVDFAAGIERSPLCRCRGEK